MKGEITAIDKIKALEGALAKARREQDWGMLSVHAESIATLSEELRGAAEPLNPESETTRLREENRRLKNENAWLRMYAGRYANAVNHFFAVRSEYDDSDGKGDAQAVSTASEQMLFAEEELRNALP
jgi:hypothetical protein